MSSAALDRVGSRLDYLDFYGLWRGELAGRPVDLRFGRQVLNLAPGVEALTAVPDEGDQVAAIGDNRKLLVFPLSQVPEMARGRGVILQKHKDGGLSDVRVFTLSEGLSWRLGEDRTRTEMKLDDWRGDRAQAGRLPPNGFPRSNKF